MNDQRIIERLNRCVNKIQDQDIRIMEICGTHTQAVSESGIRYLLPCNVHLLSGPGCPVCVTSEFFIDNAIELLKMEDIILVSFGDMTKVKGTKENLAEEQSQGTKTTVVYSPEDVLSIAGKNKDKSVVFAAVGFETTAPLIAATVKQACTRGFDNLFFLTALKCMDPAIRFILRDKRNKIDAMICPGHVASVMGADYFRFITEEFGVPAAVSGFEPADISAGICLLLEQLARKRPVEFVNLYKRCVSPAGNTLAQHMLNEVFDAVDGVWRGIGKIKQSALVLNDNYAHLDAAKRFGLKAEQHPSPVSCICSDILLGIKLPEQCSFFGSVCTPDHPSGPCMVSREGSCAVHYRFGRNEANG